MSINVNNDKNIPIDPDACYEDWLVRRTCTSKRQRKK
jgi:hypothetical protein